ncbi:MAG: hypothetical protein JXA99_12225 [Candidatus Lokiarchaeota archaeon]|nr:hypothetical protein [Candidatus Lokiarchaeota archaeon]
MEDFSIRPYNFPRKRYYFRLNWPFFGYYHFIRPYQCLQMKNRMLSEKWVKKTPFMSAGITKHIWTFQELYYYRFYSKRGGVT